MACALTLGAAMPATANAFENVLYRGTVQVASNDGRGWGPRVSDGRSYILDLRLSLPREANETVGTTSYKAVGGIVACRGTVRLVDASLWHDGRGADAVYLAEKRRSPSTRKASPGKRRAITRARKWCRSGAWRFGLGYGTAFEPAAKQVSLRDGIEAWSPSTYTLALRP